MARNYSSVSEPKTLTANVSSVATQITLNNVTGLPSVPYVLVLNPDTANEEVILVTTDQTGVTSPTVKVSRAIETGASAKTHTTGDTVKHMIVGTDLQIVHDHFSATTGVHGIAGALAPIASPTFTGTVVLPSTTSVGNVSSTELAYVDGVTSAIQTQLNTLTTSVSTAVPSGTLIMFAGAIAGASAPTGYLLCDGTAVSRTTYATLFGVISTTYGVGDNSTTFNLPDLRGRAPIGVGTGTGLTARALAATVGTETHALTSAQMPRHNHGINPAMIVGTGTTGTAAYSPTGSSNQQSVTTYFAGGSGTTEVASNGDAHPNMQPSLAVNFIIKY
jgi:microcystin-dependent protein